MTENDCDLTSNYTLAKDGIHLFIGLFISASMIAVGIHFGLLLIFF